MKKKAILLSITTVLVWPVFAGVIKEAQARREVDDARQALSAMEARKELSGFLPELEAYRARIFYNKAQQFLNDGEYDKASFYGVLSANYSKMSVAKALLAKAERDQLTALAQGRALEMAGPTLKAAGLKQKGASSVFSGSYDIKALYNLKKVPAVEEIPALTDESKKNIEDIAGVVASQPDIKVQLVAKGKTEEHAAKYAESVKYAMVEKGVAAERINVTTKKGKDGVDITLEGVKTK
ncbi:MAG: hypothetical protein N2Z22_01475 [Turneriella sp.]|nr:hypothetical protein [Turneriella sp.]